MKIEYLGHSCFYFKGEEFSVVLDPFGDIGYPLKRVKADYALSSHAHYDHNFFEGVDCGKCIEEDTPPFYAIDCFHDEVSGLKRGKNKAFYFTLDGILVLHLGDLGEPFTEKAAEKFCIKPDVLLIPVGGKYTVDGKDAYLYAKKIGAKITVPMHCNLEGASVDVSSPKEFLSLVGEYQTVKNKLELTRSQLDDLDKKTILITVK